MQPIMSNEGIKLRETADNLVHSDCVCSQGDRLLFLKKNHNEKFYELIVQIKNGALEECEFD